MGKSTSIAINVTGNVTSTLLSMRNAVQMFSKDTEGAQKKLDAFDDEVKRIKNSLPGLSNELKAAEKQFALVGDEASRLRAEEAQMNFTNAKRNLQLVSDNAKDAVKELKNLDAQGVKMDNRAGGSGGSGGAGGIVSALGAAGVTSFLGGILTDVGSAYVGSAFGTEGSTYFSSALSGLTSGAAMGAALGSIIPGLGTAIGGAIGAAVGGVGGLIQGQAKIFESKDEQFKEYYQGLYSDVTAAQAATLQGGIGIASKREQDKISFTTLLGGEANAGQYLSELVDFAAVTPFGYDSLADISKTLLAYGYKQDELLPLLTKIGDSGATLGMSPDDMNAIAVSLGRMEVSGKATSKYLNPLLERGIPVWEYLAEAMGVTEEKAVDMVNKGLVPGKVAAQALADYMGAAGEGGMARQAETYGGLVSTLEDAEAELQNAMGAGYTQARTTGLQEQIDFFEGETGAAMLDAYGQIGQWQASLENQKEQFQRDAMTGVMSGLVPESFAGTASEGRIKELAKEYAELSQDETAEAGAKMGALLAEAQAIAVNEYNASEGAQLQLETQLKLADSIKDHSALNQSYYSAGQQMAQQFSLGLKSAVDFSSLSLESAIEAHGRGVGTTADLVGKSVSGILGGGSFGNTVASLMGYPASGHAYGLDRVPYDNYPAILHEGERVLTASQARSQGDASQIVISGNNFTVREEADIGKIASELARQLEQASQLAQ